MLSNISIDGIVMPRTRSLEIGGTDVSIETEMANKKWVKDYIGWRVELKANWEWVPEDTLKAVIQSVKSGRYLPIKYPTPNGDASGNFKVTIGDQKIFKFKNGAPMWYNVSLAATAQEVQRAER